jgi:hypothetical protein
MGIEPESQFGLKFDVIHCREFYPFTRTNSIQFITGYLNMFERHLNQNGIIVVTLAHTEKCILNVINLLSLNNNKLKYNQIMLPSRHIYRYIKCFPISISLTHLVKRILNKDNAYCLIFK